ncbi:DNA-binding transcriptional MerR regulator [Amycolatopsis lexingtonensis]|uniref:DNA-binding transcriptional MerR regulator n=1 Tax=Amycolatopsis lexingtonensis TaxID=218822 RepID=A0ABR9HX56_9PSEU|nr:MerR family transcriptional regulator [Amycolatopsis lexingtonensis]MBE1495519.1 DNA-binding transcriptional MerR regulator [Amycolatopsis lexingtonensis]
MAGVAGEQVWLTILEASRRSGLSEPTLRYYEQIGLIGPVPRDPSSGHRRYDAETLEVLDSLGCLRSAGLRVEDLRRYLALLARGDEAAAEQRELFDHHADRLEAEIERLRSRLAYLRLKARLWDARDRGDADTAKRLVPELLALIERF